MVCRFLTPGLRRRTFSESQDKVFRSVCPNGSKIKKNKSTRLFLFLFLMFDLAVGCHTDGMAGGAIIRRQRLAVGGGGGPLGAAHCGSTVADIYMKIGRLAFRE